MPPVNPQPSEHFIDGVHAMGYREGYKDAQKQKSGKWIKWWEVIKHERSEEHIAHWKCSVCDKEQDPHSAKFINFCPHCGAKLVEPQESEDKE